ncbi:Ada metal-binding domain-containing protein [Selenomonas ruminantium]|uniref:Ada metal-binding domain-containing protein n=1 Tax=Selenomonas ruminantium TaxID=971 RepID=UPI00210A579F|nr:Ada metal-binding domain-containing protein [Selenomonas ruminantium]
MYFRRRYRLSYLGGLFADGYHASHGHGLSGQSVFHYSTCRTIKHPENFIPYSSREAAVNDGYVPCKVCHP